MNLLAEHGPQDLKSAWMYFKHWVKGRPVGPETCPTDKLRPTDIMYTPTDGPLVVPGTYVTKPPVGQRSDFHNNMPAKLRGAEPRSERIMEAGLLQTINTAVQGGVATALDTSTPATTGKARDFSASREPMQDLLQTVIETSLDEGVELALATDADFVPATGGMHRWSSTGGVYSTKAPLPPFTPSGTATSGYDDDFMNAQQEALPPQTPNEEIELLSPQERRSLKAQLKAQLGATAEALTAVGPSPEERRILKGQLQRELRQTAGEATDALNAVSPGPRGAAETRAVASTRANRPLPRRSGRFGRQKI